MEEGGNDEAARKIEILNEMQSLRDRLDKAGASSMAQKLISLLRHLKDLERKETELQSRDDAEHSQLQLKVEKLEEQLAEGVDDGSLCEDLDQSLCESLEKLNSAKRKLARILREILSLKRQLDDIPVQSELIQYELRFSELYNHIQEKHRQTRKYYATYNALLEIKDVMLKETSLLNSISTQFHDAISSANGRTKLIDSLNGIVKGTEQKLEKVQLAFQAEQKSYDAIKGVYTAAIAKQRQCYSLLKVFQEECAKNERLRKQTTAIISRHP